MSYAKDSKAADEDTRVADFNHFVIFDPRNLLACHDFKCAAAAAAAGAAQRACCCDCVRSMWQRRPGQVSGRRAAC